MALRPSKNGLKMSRKTHLQYNTIKTAHVTLTSHTPFYGFIKSYLTRAPFDTSGVISLEDQEGKYSEPFA